MPASTPVPRERGVVDGAGQPEIREQHAIDRVLQQNVGRLHVAVHDSLRVGRRQSGRRLPRDPQHLFDLERPVLVDAGLQRVPRHELHHQVRQRRHPIRRRRWE